MTYKINLKKSALWVAAAMLMVSCSDWTETESIKIKYPDLKKDNPELYEAYTQSLRDYRKSDHKVVVCKFDNKVKTPAGQAEHINALPDSVDYVILMTPGSVSKEISEEMFEVRNVKGMKVMYEISYSDIVAAYKSHVEWWKSMHPDTPDSEDEAEEQEMNPSVPVDTLISQDNFVRAAVESQLKFFDQYGYDGLSVSYTGVNPLSISSANMPAYLEAQEAFFGKISEWRKANPTAKFFFEGTPQYVQGENASLATGADYIIIPAESQLNAYGFSYLVNQSLRYDNIPADRFIIGVTTVSITDPGDTKGTFIDTDDNGNPLTAIIGAAYWASQITSGFTKSGICISNAQNDYFNIQFVYPNIRKAISIMNPSPLN